MYVERIHNLLDSLVKENHLDCFDMIEELIASAAEYIKIVTTLEIYLSTTRITKDAEEYREIIYGMEDLRKTAHNSLIVNVIAIN